MAWQTIVKSSKGQAVAPNLSDYPKARATFSWDYARRELDGLPGGRGLNIAHEAVDRHAVGPRREHLALRWLGKKGEVRDFTYARLQTLTNRFANVLGRSASGRAIASMSCRAHSRALRGRARHAEEPAASSAPLLGLRPRADPGAPDDRRGPGARHHGVCSTSARSRRYAPRFPISNTSLLVGDDRSRRGSRHRDYRALMADADDTSRSGPPIRGHGAAALHQWHDRHARRAPCTSTRPWLPITSPASWRSTCIPTTSSGARPIRAG